MNAITEFPLLDANKTSLTAVQSQLAQLAQGTLAAFRKWGDLQATAGTQLLHAQLDTWQPQGVSTSVQNLFGLPFGLSTDLVAQQKETLQSLLTRNNKLVDDLRKAQTKDEISLVLLGYVGDVDSLLKDSAGKVVTLLNSVSSAATVLTDRTLNDLIAANPQHA